MEPKILANIVGYIAAAIGTCIFIPQAWLVFKTKKTTGISLITYSLLTLVSAVWVIYGILTNATPVILVNIIVGCLSAYIVLMKLKYK